MGITVTKKTSTKRKPFILEDIFEKSLWATRYIIILPIIFSLIGSILMFIIGSIDIINVVQEVINFFIQGNHEYDLPVLIHTWIRSLFIFPLQG